MQTVTPIQPGVGTASAKESPLAGSDDGAFPATLRDALTAADGNASPPAAGNMPPPQDRAGQAAPFPAGPPPAADGSAQPALDPGPLRTGGAPAGAATAVVAADPTSPSLTPASATPPQQDRAGQAPPLPPGSPPAADGSGAPADPAPHIGAALQDIAAARRAANPPDAKPARTAPTARAARLEPSPRPPAADGDPLPQPAAAEAGRADDARRDSADAASAAAATADPASVPPAPVALPQAPVTSPPALAARQPARVAAAATPPAGGPVTGGPGVDRPAGLPDETSTDIDDSGDTGPLHVGQPAKNGPPPVLAGEAPARVGGAPVVEVPPAQAAAPPQLAQATVSAPVAGAGTAAAADTAPSDHVPDVAIDAPPGSAQFGPQLGERLLWLVRDGIHEARLQLNPRELGPVEVRLSVGDGAAQVSFSAQHAGTAAAVQQSLPQLRDLLAQQGLQLGQASVFHQPAGDGAASGQQQAQHSGAPWGSAGGRGLDFDDGPSVATAQVIGRGLVDAYA